MAEARAGMAELQLSGIAVYMAMLAGLTASIAGDPAAAERAARDARARLPKSNGEARRPVPPSGGTGVDLAAPRTGHCPSDHPALPLDRGRGVALLLAYGGAPPYDVGPGAEGRGPLVYPKHAAANGGGALPGEVDDASA